MLTLKNIATVFVVFTFVTICLVNSAETVQMKVHPGLISDDGVVAPENFVRIGSKFYFIEGKQQLNWYAALHKCRSLNADLANIKSDQEIDDLGQWLAAKNYVNGERFWFSANTLGRTDRVYMSSASGLPVRYMRWAAGEPNNNGLEYCAHLYHRDGWASNDWECNKPAYYICQARDPKTIVLTVWEG